MKKVRKGDQVVVIAGKDKGKRGTVLSLIGENKLLIDGVNIVRKHQRAVPMRGLTGGIVEKPMPIHSSNVSLYNQVTNKPDKIGFRLLGDGRKVRFFKSTNEVVDV